jgi:hypothetical protein
MCLPSFYLPFQQLTQHSYHEIHVLNANRVVNYINLKYFINKK